MSATRTPWPLVRFAAAMARHDVAAARRAVRAARTARLPRVAAEETALMLVLYAGYPAALEGARVLLDAWPGRARRSREAGAARRRARGLALSRRVYGAVHARLVERVRRLHPDLAVWMIDDGYGRVLARSGLDARARELVTVAVLAATGWERQLVSHLLGAVRLGASAGEVRRAWAIGARAAAPVARAAAGRAWRVAGVSARPSD